MPQPSSACPSEFRRTSSNANDKRCCSGLVRMHRQIPIFCKPDSAAGTASGLGGRFSARMRRLAPSIDETDEPLLYAIGSVRLFASRPFFLASFLTACLARFSALICPGSASTR